MITALILIFLAGVAEFFKDLSEEGKLKGYWDKNHRPQVWAMRRGGYDITGEVIIHDPEWTQTLYPEENEFWWKVHWLQGPKWDWIPVWIRQYLAFRDGWHLLKFFSVNLWALAIGVLASPESEASIYGVDIPVWLFVYVVIRLVFSAPETLGRIIYNKVV